MTEQDYAAEAAAIVQAWARCVDRLMAVAPVRAVMDETGIPPRGHTTQPERDAIRAEAREVVARWLARDLALLDAPAPSEPEGEAERLAANDELLYVRGKRDGKIVPVLYKRIPAPSEPGRCDDDFYCGECPDCLSGEHPENRLRGDG